MTLEKLIEEWAKDCIIDDQKLDLESLRSTKLHSKYMTILIEHRLKLRKLDIEFKELKKWKISYYRGEFNNADDMARYNIDKPFKQMILNTDIPIWLDADKDLNALLVKKIVHEEIVEYCKLIIAQLQKRGFEVGNAIKWRMFIGGA